MDLGNYSKLEIPTYHLLMRISIDKDVKVLHVDTYVDNGANTINKTQVASMILAGTSIGFSSVLELYALESKNISTDNLYWDSAYAKEGESAKKGVFILDGIAIPSTGVPFEMTENGDLISFAGKMDAFVINTDDLRDVDGDGYKDMFIFMTYNTARVNRLQDFATGSGQAMDDEKMSFKSDFSLFVREGDT